MNGKLIPVEFLRSSLFGKRWGIRKIESTQPHNLIYRHQAWTGTNGVCFKATISKFLFKHQQYYPTPTPPPPQNKNSHDHSLPVLVLLLFMLTLVALCINGLANRPGRIPSLAQCHLGWAPTPDNPAKDNMSWQDIVLKS